MTTRLTNGEQMQVHPVADIFPAMSPSEFNALRDDIATNGLREPIWTWQGQIIDGRHRWRACSELGVDCDEREYDGEESSLAAFVVSLNLHRRHLSESQRAQVADRLATMRQGARTDLSQICEMSQQQAADLLNVSKRSVEYARVVRVQGAPELAQAVESGVVSVSAAATIAGVPQAEQTVIVARGEREILNAAREIRARKAETRHAERLDRLVEISTGNVPLDGLGRYPVVYADPPWRYEHSESMSRDIENHYPTMSLADIEALPVGDICTEDCVLFLWATSPKLAEAMRVLDAWGFTYRTCAVWDKQQIGMGYYFRQQHELLLVATRGAPPAPLPANRPASVFSFPRGEHSAKPEWVYEAIEAMYPPLPKVELFCRSPRAGWSVWGNQAHAA